MNLLTEGPAAGLPPIMGACLGSVEDSLRCLVSVPFVAGHWIWATDARIIARVERDRFPGWREVEMPPFSPRVNVKPNFPDAINLWEQYAGEIEHLFQSSTVPISDPGEPTWIACDECHGTGRVGPKKDPDAYECEDCEGAGKWEDPTYHDVADYAGWPSPWRIAGGYARKLRSHGITRLTLPIKRSWPALWASHDGLVEGLVMPVGGDEAAKKGGES